jgi:hypothetical protein
MAVVAHLAPSLLRLDHIIRNSKNNRNPNTKLDTVEVKYDGEMQSSTIPSDWMDRIFTYTDLGLGLELLENKTNDGKGPQYQKVKSSEIEFITTDRQFMMILRMIADTSISNVSNEFDDTSNTEFEDGVYITWLEIIQCYKICITGMIALEHIPSLIARSSESVTTPTNCNDDVRSRTRNRTLHMISLFRSSSHLSQSNIVQQQKRRYQSLHTLKSRFSVDSNDSTRLKKHGHKKSYNSDKKERNRTVNLRYQVVRNSKSWYALLFLLATVAMLVVIVLGRMRMVNPTSSVSTRSEVFHALDRSGINSTMIAAPPQLCDQIDDDITPSNERANKKGAKRAVSENLNPTHSYKQESAIGNRRINTEKIFESTSYRSGEIGYIQTISSTGRYPNIVAERADYSPMFISVPSIAMASAAVASTTVVPLIVGHILPAIFVPAAVVVAVSLPFLVAMNQNVREWLLTHLSRFREQNRKEFSDYLL